MIVTEYRTACVSMIAKGTLLHGDMVLENDIMIFGSLIGNIRCGGTIYVNGTVSGNITCQKAVCRNADICGDILCKNTLDVDEGTILRGDILCGTLYTYGRINGSPRVRDLIWMGKTAVVIGDVLCYELQSEPGCTLQGRLWAGKRTYG